MTDDLNHATRFANRDGSLLALALLALIAGAISGLVVAIFRLTATSRPFA